MGTYVRGSAIWFRFTNAQGKREWAPSGFSVGEESKADKAWKQLQREIRAERELLATCDDPAALSAGGVTVQVYAESWHKRRLKEKPAAARENRWQLDRYILPALGNLLLADLRTKRVRAFVHELRAATREDGKPLASRSVCTIYGTLRTMLQDAVVDELLAVSPCTLRRGDLPTKNDSDPDWRPGAVFSPAEASLLISDDRVPEHRRVLNAVLLMTGMRPCEAFALRWRSYNPSVEPLGRLDVVRSFDSNERVEKETKTGRRRIVPVHPTLAGVLAAWKLSGWQRVTGRAPQPDDLVLPKMDGLVVLGEKQPLEHQTVDRARDLFQADLRGLGLRPRRFYDTKRTFMSLAQGDGADREMVRLMTHGPRGEVIDLYTSIPWQALCREMSKLKLELLQGKIIPLRMASGIEETAGDRDIGGTDKRKPPESGGFLNGRDWSRSSQSEQRLATSRNDSQSEEGASGNASHNPPTGACCPFVPPPAWQTTLGLADGRSLQARLDAGGLELRIGPDALALPEESLSDLQELLSKACCEATLQALRRRGGR